jgi:hypothetical protein
LPEVTNVCQCFVCEQSNFIDVYESVNKVWLHFQTNLYIFSNIPFLPILKFHFLTICGPPNNHNVEKLITPIGLLTAAIDLLVVVSFTIAEEVRHGLAPQHSWMYILFDFTPFKDISYNYLHLYLGLFLLA